MTSVGRTGVTRTAFLPFAPPVIGQEEIDEVADTLRSPWISRGPKTRRFEEEFAAYLGAPEALAVNSCTAALHTALMTLGIGPGDEVITTPMTFAATVNVIEHVGARPILVDVLPATLNLDPSHVAAAITPRTMNAATIAPERRKPSVTPLNAMNDCSSALTPAITTITSEWRSAPIAAIRPGADRKMMVRIGRGITIGGPRSVGPVPFRTEKAATITATSEGASGAAAVTVRVPVAAVQVAPATMTVFVSWSGQLTATPRDASGNPVSGVTITLAATGTGNALTQPVGPTDASGVATGTLSSTAAGTKTVSATAGGTPVTQTADVTVQAGAVSAAQSTVSAAPTTITASSGASQSTITVTARDAFGNPISGAAVVLAATGTGNTLTQPAGPTDASGVATGTLSSTATGSKTVSSTVNGTAVTQTAPVTVQAGAVNAAQSTVSAAPTTIAASSGASQSTITVTARDQFGNPVGGAAVVLGATGSGNTLAQPAGPTNASGVATGTLSSTVVGTKTVSATAGGTPVTQTADVTVQAGAVSAAQSPVSAAPTTIVASGGTSQSTVTVTARDAFGNPISGATVVLAATGAGNTLTQPAGPTDASGVTTGTLSSTAAGNKTVSATIGGTAVTQTATVTVQGAAATQLAFTVQPTNTVMGATITPAVQVTARDQFGNTAASSTDNVTLAIGNNPPGNGVLDGTTTVAAVGGVASFSTLDIDEEGNGYTLTATSGALTQAGRQFSPFLVSAEGLGVFPDLRAPRILWVGLHGEQQAGLIRVAAEVDRALTGVGFTPELRPFSPHLTLARIKERSREIGRLMTDSGFLTGAEQIGGLDDLARHLGFGPHDHRHRIGHHGQQLRLGQPLRQHDDLKLGALLEQCDSFG